MSHKISSHIRSNVVGYVALFFAFTGGAYAVTIAPKNSVVSRSIKNRQVKKADLAANAVNGAKVADGSLSGADILDGSLTGADVQESSLGTVPSATNATHATSADSATNAGHATNSDQLGGSLPSAFVQTSQIGAFIDAPGVLNGGFAIPDCPTFGGSGWIDRSSDVNEPAGYWRDPFGVVHLRGSVYRCGFAGTTIFTLPAGFRPGKDQHFAAAMEGSTPDTGQVEVFINGDVRGIDVTVNKSVSLDGITFR
jgi:hypothetical protein